MTPILNFLPLLFWMMGFYALNFIGPKPDENAAKGVFMMWIIGTVIFLSVGIWITARA